MRGAHQLAVSVRATVSPGRAADLRATLEAIAAGDDAAPSFAFAELPGVHFARLLLLEDSVDPSGATIPASLLYMSEIDAPLAPHLDGLAGRAAAALDATFGLCEGYTPQARRDFLQAHLIPTQAHYVNTIGRTVDQIVREDRLRRAIEAFLDRRTPGPAETPEDVRADIQRFVRADPDLDWATRRAPPPSLRRRVEDVLDGVGVAAALALAAPLLLLVLPFYALALRLHELREDAPHIRPDPEHARRLAALEDHAAQNQFSAIGYVKPGRFRRVTAQAVLWLIGKAARHVFRRADLSGVKTIHFARWTVLDDWRRVIFTSYYDGSLESYMDDFIDKVAYGLNASFSNGIGFPKTRFLLFDGARREQEFKDYLRRHQLPTQVWYSAYDQLSAINIENNALIRSGLFGPLTRPDTEAWLRRL
jgi:hypothetical protein